MAAAEARVAAYVPSDGFGLDARTSPTPPAGDLLILPLSPSSSSLAVATGARRSRTGSLVRRVGNPIGANTPFRADDNAGSSNGDDGPMSGFGRRPGSPSDGTGFTAFPPNIPVALFGATAAGDDFARADRCGAEIGLLSLSPPPQGACVRACMRAWWQL